MIEWVEEHYAAACADTNAPRQMIIKDRVLDRLHPLACPTIEKTGIMTNRLAIGLHITICMYVGNIQICASASP